jgi:hypothetical protein
MFRNPLGNNLQMLKGVTHWVLHEATFGGILVGPHQ